MDFTNLEKKVEYLIHLKMQLEQENHSLKKKLTTLTQKQALLTEKHEKARVKIKRAISNLRKDIHD